MSGSSLWLVPPSNSALNTALQYLIANQIPSLFPNAALPLFIPHVTLTADTIPANAAHNPDKWLHDLTLPDTQGLKLTIHGPKVGIIRFQKLTLACGKTAALRELAVACRAADGGEHEEAKAKEWAENAYYPHVSLMYSDISSAEVEAKLGDIRAAITTARLPSDTSGQNVCSAKGARIVLVPTFKSVEEWKPIAERALPDVEWAWEE